MRINNFIKVSIVFCLCCCALNSCDYGLYDGERYSVYTYNAAPPHLPVFHRKPFRHIPPTRHHHNRLHQPKSYLWQNRGPKPKNNRYGGPGFKPESRSDWKPSNKQMSPSNFNRPLRLFKR